MFDQNYFKKNKIYTINGYHYFVMDGGLSEGEAFEPIIVEKNGKESLKYRPIDKYQFTDGTYSDIKCMSGKDFLVEYGFYSTDFNNPFTRTLKITKGVNRINNWEESIKHFDLRLSKKAEEEIALKKEEEKTAQLRAYKEEILKEYKVMKEQYKKTNSSYKILYNSEIKNIDKGMKELSKIKKK